jgi:hypothetical protein
MYKIKYKGFDHISNAEAKILKLSSVYTRFYEGGNIFKVLYLCKESENDSHKLKVTLIYVSRDKDYYDGFSTNDIEESTILQLEDSVKKMANGIIELRKNILKELIPDIKDIIPNGFYEVSMIPEIDVALYYWEKATNPLTKSDYKSRISITNTKDERMEFIYCYRKIGGKAWKKYHIYKIAFKRPNQSSEQSIYDTIILAGFFVKDTKEIEPLCCDIAKIVIPYISTVYETDTAIRVGRITLSKSDDAKLKSLADLASNLNSSVYSSFWVIKHYGLP